MIVPDDLAERAYSVYVEEYRKCFPAGGDVHDHDDAVAQAVEAVVALVLSLTEGGHDGLSHS